MEKEELIKAKETLLKNVIKEVKKGEIKFEYYSMLNNAIYDFIIKEKEEAQKEKDEKWREDMKKTYSTLFGKL